MTGNEKKIRRILKDIACEHLDFKSYLRRLYTVPSFLFITLFPSLVHSTFEVCNYCFSSNIFFYNGQAPQPAFTCSKLTIETLEQGVKYVQS